MSCFTATSRPSHPEFEQHHKEKPKQDKSCRPGQLIVDLRQNIDLANNVFPAPYDFRLQWYFPGPYFAQRADHETCEYTQGDVPKTGESVAENPGKTQNAGQTTQQENEQNLQMLPGKRITQNGSDEGILAEDEQNESPAQSREDHGADGKQSAQKQKPV